MRQQAAALDHDGRRRWRTRAIQPGSVWRATRISPGASASSARIAITRALAVHHARAAAGAAARRAASPAAGAPARRRVAHGRRCAAPRTVKRSGGSGRSAAPPSRPCAAPTSALEVGGDAEAFDRAEHLVDREDEDVARLVEQAERGELRAHGEEDAAHAAEQARALEAQILAVAHARLGPAEHRRASRRLSGLAGEQRVERCAARAGRVAARGRSARRPRRSPCSSGAGSSRSVMLSSFSSSVQRSPNLAM